MEEVLEVGVVATTPVKLVECLILEIVETLEKGTETEDKAVEAKITEDDCENTA